MKEFDDTKSLNEAFGELMTEAFHGKVKRESLQWNSLRKFFFAGALFLAIKARDGNQQDVNEILDELQNFFDEIKLNVKTRQDIERSGQ